MKSQEFPEKEMGEVQINFKWIVREARTESGMKEAARSTVSHLSSRVSEATKSLNVLLHFLGKHLDLRIVLNKILFYSCYFFLLVRLNRLMHYIQNVSDLYATIGV